MTPEPGRERRRALNEALARDVNELIDEVATNWFERDETVEFRCECARLDCAEPVDLTREEYATVRDDPLLFVVVEGHEDLELEVVVAHIRSYPVVRKTGAGAEVAEATDPRADG